METWQWNDSTIYSRYLTATRLVGRFEDDTTTTPRPVRASENDRREIERHHDDNDLSAFTLASSGENATVFLLYVTRYHNNRFAAAPNKNRLSTRPVRENPRGRSVRLFFPEPRARRDRSIGRRRRSRPTSLVFATWRARKRGIVTAVPAVYVVTRSCSKRTRRRHDDRNAEGRSAEIYRRAMATVVPFARSTRFARARRRKSLLGNRHCQYVQNRLLWSAPRKHHTTLSHCWQHSRWRVHVRSPRPSTRTSKTDATWASVQINRIEWRTAQ